MATKIGIRGSIYGGLDPPQAIIVGMIAQVANGPKGVSQMKFLVAKCAETTC